MRFTHESYAILGLFLAITGSFLFLVFLHNVESNPPIYILTVATLIMAASAVLSYYAIKDKSRKSKLYFLLTITILSLCINLVPTARYDVFSGLGSPDNLEEYFVADVTLRNGFWGRTYGVSFETRAPAYYFSCLSITIFPTILSEVTGLDLSQVFSFVYPLIFSLIPVLIFLMIDRAFQNVELAALSAILYLEMYRFSAPQHGRQFMAILFLVLMVFTVFKEHTSSKKTRNYLVLFFIFGFGVIVSHYTVSYFMLVIFFAMILGSHFSLGFRSSSRSINLINKRNFAYLLVLCFSWLLFFNFEYFSLSASVIENSILAMLRLTEQKWLSAERTPGGTSGTIVTGWYILQTALMIVGLLFAFYEKKKKTRVFLAWSLSALVLFSIFFATLVTPVFTSAVAFNRVYSMSLPLWIPFLAYVLLKTNKKLKYAFLVFFLIVNLPINLGLPSYDRFVTFSPVKDVSPELAISQTFVLESDYLMWNWAQEYLSLNESISVDIRGALTMYFVHTLIPKSVDEPRFGLNSSYLALHFYNVKYKLWWSTTNISETTNINGILANSTIAYSNGESFMLVKK